VTRRYPFLLNAVAACSLFLLTTVAFAAQVSDALHIGPPAVTASFANLQNSAAKVQSRFGLGPLTTAERARLTQTASDFRAKVGIVRTIEGAVLDLRGSDIPAELPANIAGGLLERRGDGYVWTGGVTSDGAGALRLNFSNTILPRSARVFVYSSQGEVHGPYTADEMTASFWSNTVFSDEVFVELQFSAAASDRIHLEIGSIAHLEHAEFAPPAKLIVASSLEDQYSCFLETPCVPSSEFS
jgi:hypothetical protein